MENTIQLKDTIDTTSDDNEMDSASSGHTRPQLLHQHSCGSAIQPPTTNGVDRKALRQTLYSGIFYKHRRTIFALGSFLRMLRSRNSDYNAIKGEPDTE
ncbi:uncharacterized protein LOC123302418 isoform X2 [Chrysoperla carnea]|uniref:uncharacterized protein LOC123302418 isoform X2 n=1 Tax=Chrysoperla carnea TaxID=189513 RepID=UPI001D07C7E4|nr:uncharacterized protein LOC123302418 isoform X2 [Chrysoperla carnea]